MNARPRAVLAVVGFSLCITVCVFAASGPEIAGVSVTPHVAAAGMRYRRAAEPELGARIQVFLRQGTGDSPLRLSSSNPPLINGKAPEAWLTSRDWMWHDLPSAISNADLSLPPGALTVWTFNARTAAWTTGTPIELRIPQDAGVAAHQLSFTAKPPDLWISSMSFLGNETNVHPERMVLYVDSQSTNPWRFVQVRFWLPDSGATWQILRPSPWQTNLTCFPADGWVDAGDQAGFRVGTGALPLTYCAVEVELRDGGGHSRSLWAHRRIWRETFDISGGWTASNINGRNSLTLEPYLKTLRRFHINTAHIAATPGYTDDDGPGGLYRRYPLKYFNALQPLDAYDNDRVLPRIHAVEFLGEPQYGGGRPVAPMEVWRKLAPYAPTRLPTTVTHSEERIWRWYAGLSDFPHFDAYRVTAPAADAWRNYERWGEERIAWGAPLETIGEMCRSLRELNRPSPIAYWSQGPHAGWDRYGGRSRTTPTPEELRMQAYHALASRITSLYWFNLSLKSLVKWRDTFGELERIGREMRLLDEFYLEGDAYRQERLLRDGKPDWDLASIVGPQVALLFALDLEYHPDSAEKVFKFGPPREARWRFALPRWLREPAAVLRVDANGVRPAEFRSAAGGVEIHDKASQVAVYVVTPDVGMREWLERKLARLRDAERSFDFDPAGSDADFQVLSGLLESR